jgi:excinuclease ABC subunit A
MEVIKCADYIVDLGPVGGDKGGYILFEGSPEELADLEGNSTGFYLREKLGLKKL